MLDISKPKTDKNIKKVILWGKDDLLNCSVRLLLDARIDWEVTSLLDDKNGKDLFVEAEKIQPDVFIIRQSGGDEGECLHNRILSNYPAITVIAVNPDNNSMEVYIKKNICIEKISDLISEIEETPRIRKE